MEINFSKYIFDVLFWLTQHILSLIVLHSSLQYLLPSTFQRSLYRVGRVFVTKKQNLIKQINGSCFIICKVNRYWVKTCSNRPLRKQKRCQYVFQIIHCEFRVDTFMLWPDRFTFHRGYVTTAFKRAIYIIKQSLSYRVHIVL